RSRRAVHCGQRRGPRPAVVRPERAGSPIGRAGLATGPGQLAEGRRTGQPAAPWHRLYFLPLPHGQGALREEAATTWPDDAPGPLDGTPAPLPPPRGDGLRP